MLGSTSYSRTEHIAIYYQTNGEARCAFSADLLDLVLTSTGTSGQLVPFPAIPLYITAKQDGGGEDRRITTPSSEYVSISHGMRRLLRQLLMSIMPCQRYLQ